MPAFSPSVYREAEKFANLTVNVIVEPFKQVLIAFLVICQLPFAIVSNLLFLEFLEMLFPMIKSLIPGATGVRQWIMDSFEAKRQEIKNMLAEATSQVHFSFDLWTSPNHLALLGIVAHFVDKQGQCQSVSYPYCAFRGY